MPMGIKMTIYILIFLLLAIGFYETIAYIMNFPPRSTAKGIRKAVTQKTDLINL